MERKMPSRSPAQARLMAAVAHDPEFAAKVRISQAVGREFNQADKGTGILNKPRGHYTNDSEGLHDHLNLKGKR